MDTEIVRDTWEDIAPLPLDYIAGLVDADGSISISVSKNRYVSKGTNNKSQFSFVVNLRLLPKHKKILEQVRFTLQAGTLYEHKPYSKTSSAMVSWQTTNHSDTLTVCAILLPYLHIKNKEATLMIQALTAWIGLGTRRKPDDLKAFVLEIASRMNEGQQKNSRLKNDEQ